MSTYGKIKLGTPGDKGWYLLSAAKAAPPILKGSASTTKYTNDSTANTNMAKFATDHPSLADIPFSCLSNFEQLIVDNFHYDTSITTGKTLEGKLQFGTNIYYFNHETQNSSIGDGWSATKNFLQSDWNTEPLSGYKWNGDTVQSGTAIPTSTDYSSKAALNITADTAKSNTYRHVPIDMRKGYWVYIVSNEPLAS